MKQSIGKRVKDARLERGLSQEKAAVEMGISRNTLASIENGREPSDITRVKLERFLEAVAA